MRNVIIVGVLAMLGSAIPTLINGRQQRKAKEADWARQDLVAERAAAAAADLIASNKQVAEVTAATAQAAMAKMTEATDGIAVVHTILNSEKTASIERELVLLREVADLKRAAGHEPSQEALAAIANLEAELADRKTQAAIVEQQLRIQADRQ